MKSPILVWDEDGVIFDGTMEILAKVFAESLYRRFGTPLEEGIKYMYQTTGTPTATQYKNLLISRGLLPTNTTESDETIKKLVKYFTENAYREMPPLCPDVLPTLPLLKGNRMIISTNSPQVTLDERVRYHGLNQYFLYWFGKSEQTPDKRQHKPVIIDALDIDDYEFRHLGALIGDGYTDMRIADEWRIRPIGKKTKDNSEDELRQAGAIVVVRELKDLVGLQKTLFS